MGPQVLLCRYKPPDDVFYFAANKVLTGNRKCYWTFFPHPRLLGDNAKDLGLAAWSVTCAGDPSCGLLGFSPDPVAKGCHAVCLTHLWTDVAKAPLPACGAEF